MHIKHLCSMFCISCSFWKYLKFETSLYEVLYYIINLSFDIQCYGKHFERHRQHHWFQILQSNSRSLSGRCNQLLPLYFYINSIIHKVKEFGPDGFLYIIHFLTDNTVHLMDYTVIFATSCWAMEPTLVLLIEITVGLHMSRDPDKSKFMTVNTSDTGPFIINDITILYTDSYVYLSCTISNAQCNNSWQTT